MRHYVFIDECSYNIWTARNHGMERQGMRAYSQVCDQRGWDMTVALAVSPVKWPDVSLRRYRRNEYTSLKRLSGLEEAKSIPRREGYLLLRRCASTSRSRHPRAQNRAGDAPGLQPIPEHSRAGNQITEDNDKRRRIEAQNTGSNGRQSGSETSRYPYMSNTPKLSRIVRDTQRSDPQEARPRET